MASSSRELIIKNGEIFTGVSKKDLLEQTTHGVYTTTRTIHIKSLVEFDEHVKRLSASAQSVAIKPNNKPYESYVAITADPALLRPYLTKACTTALTHYQQHNPDFDHELRVYLLLDWTKDTPPQPGFDVYVFMEPLPPPPSPPVALAVCRRPPERKVGADGHIAKDTQWIHDRKTLEARKGDANEVLMVDESGLIMEGTQSNFFYVMDGKLHTPFRNDVLVGTIQKIIFRVCEENNIPLVKSDSLPLKDCSKWEAVFLTSTSRLVLPITHVRVLDDFAGVPKELEFPAEHELVQKVGKLVVENLQNEAYTIE